MRAINDIEFGDKRPKLNTDGRYSCPTCDKAYKTEKACQKHIDASTCFPDMKKLYGGTMTEAQAFSMVNDILPLFRRGTVSFSQFLKGNLYQNALSVVSFMITMNASHLLLEYIVWTYDTYEPKNINGLFKLCLFESTLSKFKEYYHSVIPADQDEILERFTHRDYTPNDLVRMFETCKLSVMFMTENQRLLGLYDELPPDYKDRILRVAGL